MDCPFREIWRTVLQYSQNSRYNLKTEISTGTGIKVITKPFLLSSELQILTSRADVLTQIPKYNSDYSLDLAGLLPHNWKKSKELQ